MTNPADPKLLVECLRREWVRFNRPAPPPATIIEAHLGTDADGDPIFQVAYRLVGSSEVLGVQVPVVDDPDHLAQFFEQTLFELFDEPNDTTAGFHHHDVWWWKPPGLGADQLLTADDTRVTLEPT